MFFSFIYLFSITIEAGELKSIQIFFEFLNYELILRTFQMQLKLKKLKFEIQK